MAKKLNAEEIKKAKEHAYLLFTRDNITVQKEIAARTGISEKTIGKWIKEEGWEKQRVSLILTKQEELGRLYDQLAELNDNIRGRDKGFRYANPKEADTLAKLTSSIRKLETDVSIAEAMETLKALINFVMPEDLATAKLITKWSDIFIKSKLK